MTFTAFDHQCMSLALELGRKGLTSTHPNPRVGCVIAAGNETIAGGWHERAGEPHAEIHALEKAGRKARGATAYVTLEPCNHQGRTPPCTAALIDAGVSRVVIAMKDPDYRVNGTGEEALRQAGISVETGLMSAVAEALNAGFCKRMREGRPWVRVKVATSQDGRTALRNGDSQWITGEAARADVQKWRARSDAILTGIGTLLADNPTLTARIADPPLLPLRVVVDSHWRTSPDSKLLNDPTKVLIVGSKTEAVPEALAATGVECLCLDPRADRVDLANLMARLADRQINEIQVEAGPTLCGSLLREQLVDEVLWYQAPILLGDGATGPFQLGPLESMKERTHLELQESIYLGRDLRLNFRPVYRTGAAS